MTPITAFVRAFWNDRKGVAAVTVGLFMTVIVGFAGFVIDVGHLFYVQRALQSSADSAALAGARQLNCCTTSTAASTATAYSAAWTSGTVEGSNKNAAAGLPATMVSGYPQLKCFSSTGVSCAGPDNANGIVVKQTANVPMWFAEVFGVSTVPVTVTATAGGSGGQAQTLDIDIILDTTASMGTSDPACSVSGATRLGCALAGVKTLLGELSSSADYVGVMAFPGLSSTTQQSKDTNCPTSNPTTTAYKNVPETTTSGQPTYQIQGLSHDYKSTTGGTSAPLDTSSPLVIAAGGSGVAGCNGVGSPGGFGTFYADAITAAENDLNTNGRPGVQKVIIFFSDGDANATSANMKSTEANQQCHEGITAAQAATAKGYWVYTVAYGSPTSGSCSTDTAPTISACTTMQDMASDATKFYSDDANGCASSTHSITDLVAMFQDIGASFQAPRLLPDNTT